MDKEVIEQQVLIQDQAQVHGDINLVGKVVNVIKKPSEWQDIVFRFLVTHRAVLLLAIVLEVGLGATYWSLKGLYLIPWWLWAITAVLLLAATWSWYKRFRYAGSTMQMALALGGTMAFLSLVGWQSWQIVWPPRFEEQVFGIALAELGEGPDARQTTMTREITLQVYELLCDVIATPASGAEALTGGGTAESCAENGVAANSNGDPDPDLRQVSIRKIGVVPDRGTAEWYGRKIGADIVIWGRVLAVEPSGVSIRFQVLETPDSTSSPEFPVVLPVTVTYADIFAHSNELNLESNTPELREIVARQARAISSFILGVLAYHAQDFPQAITQLETAVQAMEENLQPGDDREGLSIPYYYLGKANHFLGHIESGQTWLLKAQEVKSDEPAIDLSLAYGYRSLGKVEAYEASLDRAYKALNMRLQERPDDLAAMYDRGIAYELRGDYGFALFDYEEIVVQDPGFYVAWINLGHAALQVGDLAKAEKAMLEALRLAEETGANTAAVRLGLALVWEKAGEVDKASEAYRLAAAAAAPVDYFYHQRYARFLEAQGDYEGALLVYEEMVEIGFQKSGAWRETADFLRRRGRLDDALIYYQRAVHSDPDDPLARTYLAETYYGLGQATEALEVYKRAVTEGASDYYTYSSYGLMLYQEGEYEEAAEKFEMSVSIRPAAPEEWRNLVQIYRFLGACEDARSAAERILSLRDELPEEMVDFADEALMEIGTC